MAPTRSTCFWLRPRNQPPHRRPRFFSSDAAMSGTGSSFGQWSKAAQRRSRRGAILRRCPTHRHVMWVTSVVRPIRFHDLRHTTGSLLAMLGAEMHTIQKIMRHKDPRVTSETYLHLDPSYLRKEIDRLTFGAPE